MSKLTIAVDFDGVLHSYTTPWEREDIIPDPPVPGAIEWLNAMLREFEVYIHTTRAVSAEGQRAVRHWLHENGCQAGMNITVTRDKLPAIIYIDDRGYRFTGDNFPTASDVRRAKPWGKERADGHLWDAVERGPASRAKEPSE